MSPPTTITTAIPNRRAGGRTRRSRRVAATVSRPSALPRPSTTRGHSRRGGVDVGRLGVAAAVRDRLERARELVERSRPEHPAHLVGGDRRPVADRAAVAEPQQPGAEAQPQRVVEIAVAFGRVGRAFELVGIFGLVAGELGRSPAARVGLPRARGRVATKYATRDRDDDDRHDDQPDRPTMSVNTRPNHDTIGCSRSPSQFNWLRNGRGVGADRNCRPERMCARGRAASGHGRDHTAARAVPSLRDRHLHVERFVADAQVEVERDDRGRDERRR